MRCCRSVALAVAGVWCGAVLAAEQVIEKDDYESVAERPGKPEIVQGLVSSGLLTQTGQGVYQTKSEQVLKSVKPPLVTGEGAWLESSIRLYALEGDAELSVRLGGAKGALRLAAVLRDGKLVLAADDCGRAAGTLSAAASILPADLSLGVSPVGMFRVRVKSLADSSVRKLDGKSGVLAGYSRDGELAWALRSVSGGEAKATVDAYVTSIVRDEDASVVPFEIERLPEFDPVKAGWPLVFEDNFDGDRVEWDTKWFEPYYDQHDKSCAQLDGEGHLRIRVDFKPGVTDRTSVSNLHTCSLYTKQGFGYGYYESRFKFTEGKGWWAAFWTYGDANTNPFLDGFEIDGFEDYYLRWKEGTPWYNVLDHNLHIRGGLGRGKSWNYASDLPGTRDEWYTLGIRWTPFEITYYLNGKAIRAKSAVGHSPWDTVTFDAFNHCACTSPNHPCVSAQLMTGSWAKNWDLNLGKFPQDYYVDYVRIYAYPDPADEKPYVRWSNESTTGNVLVPTGGTVRLSAEVTPAAKTKAKLKAVYLFDNGYFLQCRTEPPYEFEIRLDDGFLGQTAYARPGRQRQVFTMNGWPHVFHVFAQDENGRVGRTELPVQRIPFYGKSSPYEGVAQKLPGKLNPARFDAGGIPVGYYVHEQTVKKWRPDLHPRPSFAFRGDEYVSCSAAGDAIDFTMTGEWLNYTVDIAETGDYTFEFPYATTSFGWVWLDFFADGKPLGRVPFEAHDGWSFAHDRTGTLRTTLPAGRHVITLLPTGPMSFGAMEVTRYASKPQPVEQVPLEVDHPKTFDPAKAGWTCVFEDEFEGTALDTNKWYRPHFARKAQAIAPDGNAHLVFHVEKGPKGKIPNSYVYSVPEFECGYYEARVKFTDKSGWWAASWVHGGSNYNPFLDGFEIDTFEDFYTRLPEEHPLHNRMAHSIHTHTGEYCASYQLHSTPPEPLDGFHTIGCKWDPLAISFYLDGQLVGGYSAFNNAACIRPLHAVLSAEASKIWMKKGATGPEAGRYEVDWVRIWRDPELSVGAPEVAWKAAADGQVFVEPGSNVVLAVSAKAVRTDDPIAEVYVFDNGYMVDRSIERPYVFRIPMTEEFYAASKYGRYAGHRGTKRPPFDTYPHVFVAYARTRSGKVAHSAPVIRIPAARPAPAAYEERPQAIPGTVVAWRFDVGGQGKAYHRLLKKDYCQRGANPRPEEKVDCSKGWLGVAYAGEWYSYTVNVAKAGRYEATFLYGSPLMSANDAELLVDGVPAGAFPLTAEQYFSFVPTHRSTIDVMLPEGRHVLTLVVKSTIGFRGIEFKEVR